LLSSKCTKLASLAAKLPGTCLATVNFVHQPNVVEAELIPLANGALVVADERSNGEEVVEFGEGFRPVMHSVQK
jgi:hypothetical protein